MYITADRGNSQYIVHVTSGGTPVVNTTVRLYLPWNGASALTATTDSSGNAYFSISSIPNELAGTGDPRSELMKTQPVFVAVASYDGESAMSYITVDPVRDLLLARPQHLSS